MSHSTCEGHPPGPFEPMGKTVFCDGSCVTVEKTWIVTAPSAYRIGHTCFLGRGATKAAAIADAFGPREAWGNATRRSMKAADVYETDAATADELEHGAQD